MDPEGNLHTNPEIPIPLNERNIPQTTILRPLYFKVYSLMKGQFPLQACTILNTKALASGEALERPSFVHEVVGPSTGVEVSELRALGCLEFRVYPWPERPTFLGFLILVSIYIVP